MAGLSVTRAALQSAAFLFVAMLAGCAGLDDFGGSRKAVEDWSRPQGFVPLPISSPSLPIYALGRGVSAEVLHVYIEGDGAVWGSPYHPPRDPTPVAPVALGMAAKDPALAVVYLGRPCQYLEAEALSACPSKFWTSHRFAPEVLSAYQQALEQLKLRFNARQLRLFGYSGGGVLATLLAGRRNDVAQLVTVVAPVAVAEWTSWHKVTSLHGSLDPAREPLDRLPPAIHYVGGRDAVTPPAVVTGFATQSGGQLRIEPDFDHQCCWSRDWRRLLEDTR